MTVKSISKLAAACLLLLAFCGCHKTAAENPAASDAAIACANSLRHITQAKAAWAQKTGASSNNTPTWDDLNRYLPRGQPVCPVGGTYTIGTMAELPKCSIARHNQHLLSHLEPGP